MATNTTNYNFKKPDESDFYSVQDQNNNWDKADAALKDLDTPTFEDYSGSATVPDAATAIGNIKSKGKLSTTFSNIKAALKGACLIGQIINNCVTDNAKLPLSAAQGKALMDLYTKLNSDLGNVKTKFPGDTKQVVFNYDDSATIGLHIPTNRFRLSLQRNSQWLGLLPIISTNPTGAIEFGQITLTKNNTTGNYDLHLYDIKGTWICKFTSTLS